MLTLPVDPTVLQQRFCKDSIYSVDKDKKVEVKESLTGPVWPRGFQEV